MNHKIVSAMVLFVAALLLVAGLVFSVTVPAAQQYTFPDLEARSGPVIPVISHDVDESTEACQECHSAEDGGLAPSHTTYPIPTCLTCHSLGTPPTE